MVTVPLPAVTVWKLSVSSVPEDGAAPEVLLERADRALYRAKAAGRNCVRTVADAPPGAAAAPDPAG